MAVFVTGAANGMGAGVSRVLHEAGATVVLSGRDVSALEAVAEGVAGIARPALRRDRRASVIDAVAGARGLPGSSLGPCERGRGHRAGRQDDWEHTLEEVEEIFSVNVYGPFLTMKHFLPVMIAARQGAVVNVGGTFGFKGAANPRPTGPRNGRCAGSPIPRRWRPGPTACGSTASIRAAWTGRACGGNWPRRRSGRACRLPDALRRFRGALGAGQDEHGYRRGERGPVPAERCGGQHHRAGPAGRWWHGCLREGAHVKLGLEGTGCPDDRARPAAWARRSRGLRRGGGHPGPADAAARGGGGLWPEPCRAAAVFACDITDEASCMGPRGKPRRGLARPTRWSTSPADRGPSARPAWRRRARSSTTSSTSTPRASST
jgi:hypothetical protein